MSVDVTWKASVGMITENYQLNLKLLSASQSIRKTLSSSCFCPDTKTSIDQRWSMLVFPSWDI